jgi:hypothetical protein
MIIYTPFEGHLRLNVFFSKTIYGHLGENKIEKYEIYAFWKN